MRWIAAIAMVASLVQANELAIDQSNDRREVCSGIYSKRDWGGSKDPYIDLTLATDATDGWIAVVIFEYRNIDLLGAQIPGVENKKYVCDELAIDSHLCDDEQLGQYIVSPNANESSYGQIVTRKIDLSDPQAIHYELKRTGFYCVSTYPFDPELKYKGVAVFQNAFGYLAGSEMPKLAFYGGAALAYALVFALWMFLYVQHRSDILPVQNYITAICGFLVVEMIVIWGYYDYTNNSNSKAGGVVYLIFVSIMNAFRNAFTFFLLLIVCLGYGVVKPSLGSLMWKCRALAAAHFVFAIGYTVTSYIQVPDNAGVFIEMFSVLPLTLTMTVFYVWILTALSTTTKVLIERKQEVKAQMFRRLWFGLLASIVVIFLFFFINSLIFARETSLHFITTNWKTRWFLLDGWLNVVYFLNFCQIAYLWRPTENNRRFAMSTQLAQDEDDVQEFDLGSLRESLDEEDRDAVEMGDMSAVHRDSLDDLPDEAPPSYKSDAADASGSSRAAAPTSTSTSQAHKLPHEGETMFAVGDDDDDDDETRGLTSKR